VKTSVKTAEALLTLLQKNPSMTLDEAAKTIGRSTRTIEMASSKLVKIGKLEFVGPQRGGYWKILPSNSK
jgi:ATP-dependent DNA helicase RecG